MLHRLSFIFCIASLLAAVTLWWNPISSKMHNGGILLGLGAAWAFGPTPVLGKLWARTDWWTRIPGLQQNWISIAGQFCLIQKS